jgi:VanZ family protein
MNRHNLYWIGPAVVWGVLLLVLTSLPKWQPIDLTFKFADKVYHFIFYTILGSLVIRAFAQGELSRTAKSIARMLLFGCLFAIADELHQHFIPGRYCDAWDAAADILGLALAGTLYYLWRVWITARDLAFSTVFVKNDQKRRSGRL